MSSTTLHPRRRPQKAMSAPTSPSPVLHGMALLKSETFHHPSKVVSDLCNPVADAHFAPKRSQTSTKNLEELLEEIDERLAGTSLSADDAGILNDREVLPVPRFMIDNAVAGSNPMDIDSKSAAVDHHHDSDSGLGSSISDAEGIAPSKSPSVSSGTSYSTITRAHPTKEHRRFLSKHAAKVINEHIVQPILKEEALKDFHPLIEDVPARIGAKFITNLRDLEKTLIFIAPVSAPYCFHSYCSIQEQSAYCCLGVQRYSVTPASYLHFAETTISYVATTVGHISERDQRLPTDRPYTNNYFLDLVEQIRKYAEIMAATREKEAKGEPLDDMDYARYVLLSTGNSACSPFYPAHKSHGPFYHNNQILPKQVSLTRSYRGEKLTIKGGISHDGKPLEFVREKDGKTIPIVEGEERELLASSSKRAFSYADLDDEEVHRSMARRRKSERPGDVVHPCSICSKEFKRPCDLTKHEKTHSRPWKCPDPKCKYHEDGWPTEKERDRHVNDKHSAAPPMHKCHFDCSYASKRESNLKQHMEKAHGWKYIRSKSNGKKKASSSASGSGSNSITPQTPLTPSIPTPSSAMPSISTPISQFNPSPATNAIPDFDFNTMPYTPAQQPYDMRRESVTTAGTEMTYSSSHSPVQPTFFDDNITPEETGFNDQFDSNFGSNMFSAPAYQQPTPAMSHHSYTDMLAPLDTTMGNTSLSHLSPGAQPNATLYSPPQFADQFGGMSTDSSVGGFNDFTLFSDHQNSAVNNDAMFQDLHGLGNVGGQFSSAAMMPSIPAEQQKELEEFFAQFSK